MQSKTEELIKLMQSGRNTLTYINDQQSILLSKLEHIKLNDYFRSSYLIEIIELQLRVWQTEETLVRKELKRCINALGEEK